MLLLEMSINLQEIKAKPHPDSLAMTMATFIVNYCNCYLIYIIYIYFIYNNIHIYMMYLLFPRIP